MKLFLFEKSRVELEFVFSIFTTRVRKHFGNSDRLGPLLEANSRGTRQVHLKQPGTQTVQMHSLPKGRRPGWAAHLPPTADQLEEIAAVFVAMQPDDGFVDYYKVLRPSRRTSRCLRPPRRDLPRASASACARAHLHGLLMSTTCPLQVKAALRGMGFAVRKQELLEVCMSPRRGHDHDGVCICTLQPEDHLRGASVLVHGEEGKITMKARELEEAAVMAHAALGSARRCGGWSAHTY